MDKKVNYAMLRNARENKGLTQKEIAAKLNIVPSAYSRLEKGDRDLRVDQLYIIAEFLGKNINEFLIEEKKHQIGDNMNKKKAIKNETELLESILCLIGTGIEDMLLHAFDRLTNNLPSIPYPYEEYIKGDDSLVCPDYAVEQIKELIKGYEEFKSDPLVWHKNRMLRIKNCGIEMIIRDEDGNEIKETIPDDYDSDYHFSHFFKKDEYDYLKNKDDKFLKEFVSKEEHYGLIYFVISCGNMMHYTKPEDLYGAFKDMLNAEPMALALFQCGLLEESWFKNYWKQYLKEEKPVSMLVKTKQGGLAIQRVRKKLKDIFIRNKQEDFYFISADDIPY